MILRPSFHALGNGVGRRIEFGNVQLFHNLRSAIQNAGVRSVELVGRTDQKIAVHFFDIDHGMGGEMYGIYEAESPFSMGQLSGFAYRRDRSQRIGSRADSQNSGFVGYDLLKLIPQKLTGARVERNRANSDAAFLRQRSPRRDIRLMVEFRDNYLIAWTQAATQGAGHMEGNRGHIVAERDFGRRGIEEIRQSLSRSQDG